MHYNVKGTEVAITDELREYIEKKLGSLDKIAGRDSARVDVVVALVAEGERQYMAEMTLHDAKAPLHAKRYGHSLYEAIDAAATELSGELTKSKKKRLHVIRHSAVKVKEFLRGFRKNI